MVRLAVFVLCLITISLIAQDQVKTDTLKKKSMPTNTTSIGGGIGSFFRGINKAAKSTVRTAHQLNSSAESFQRGMSKFSQHIEAYAPDSMRTKSDTVKMKKSATTVPAMPKTKSDSTKRKSVFEDVFKEN